MSTTYTDDPLEIPRYREFAARVAAGETQRQAMAATGIKGTNTVARLLKQQRVLDYIHELRQKHLSNINITRDDVLRGFLSAISDAKALSDPTAQIAGWREVGKFQGQYAPEEVHHKVSGGVERIERQLANMPTEQLLDFLARAERGEEVIDLSQVEEGVWEESKQNSANSADDTSQEPPTDKKGSRPSRVKRSAQDAKRKRTQKSCATRVSNAGSKKRKLVAASSRKSASSSGRSTKRSA